MSGFSTELDAREAHAKAALRSVRLHLVKPEWGGYVITDNPDCSTETVWVLKTIEMVEQYIDEQLGLAMPPAGWYDKGGVIERKPRVGDQVHYVSYGTPNGEYPSVCRAATITEVGGVLGSHPTLPIDSDVLAVGLAVMNPEGFFFNRGVIFNDGQGNPGSADCPNAAYHGQPFRYCGSCPFTEPTFIGGTWHHLGHE